MGDIVNLRRARKAKARETAAATADVNRAAFGRSRQDRTQADQEVARVKRTLDGARRD